MKAIVMILVMLVIIFSTMSLNAQIVELKWNTFLGPTAYDFGYGIALDGSGNVYVAGRSDASWGSPVNAHSGGADAFALCVDNNGNLLWNTFLGSSASDQGYHIQLDSSGNIIVVGWSDGDGWGTPINDHSGMGDAFVAKLDNSGNLIWNTFLGSNVNDSGYGIALDTSDNIFITGWSDATWGSPVNAHAGFFDAFVAKLNSSGNLVWNTFFGSTNTDEGYGIALDISGNIYVSGKSASSWGAPVNTHSGSYDAFVARIDSSGNLIWNTFLGSASQEESFALAFNSMGTVDVTGYSMDTWGSPINAYSGGQDVFVASLDSSGNLVWNTFLGSTASDCGLNITSDCSGNIYVTGYSQNTWGSPIHPYNNGGLDVIVFSLDNSGDLLWNTFLGSIYSDTGYGITTDNLGNTYITGSSDATWGSPIHAYNGSGDTFIAKLSTKPLLDIVANGSDDPITITESDVLQVRISLNRFGSGENVDYWLVYHGPSGWFHFDYGSKTWLPGLGVTFQQALTDIGSKKVFQSSGLSQGVYTFYFGVDMVMDGKLTKSELYYDEVKVTVTQ